MQQKKIVVSPLVGVDIGGTFTDIVHYIPSEGGGSLRLTKVPSTPDDPVRGLLHSLRAVDVAVDTIVVHGTTVATNALLERKGGRAALITTQGFGDVLEIGRQDRPELYDIQQQRAPVLIPRTLRLEVRERLDYQGHILQELEDEDLVCLLDEIALLQPESIAISLLYSFLDSTHEQRIATLLRERFPASYLSLSSEILPQFREYERTSTVAVNAYVQPVMAHYLHSLQKRLDHPLRIMQSSGGSISAQTAAHEPVRTVLSGPAGGVIGAFHIAQMANLSDIITLDIGGTSTDVALCPGKIPLTAEAVVAGCPVGISTVAIHTVGAGGGSRVHLDEGQALQIGPDSAGAVPGPVCYGIGDHLTVTDANLILGRLIPAYFLGGKFSLYPERAEERMRELAAQMGVSVQEAALGIIRVANANMERALRTVSLEQGYDPRRFTLLPFGGAGPLHACELAEALRIPRVFVPRYPGVLSALGMILAPVVKEYVKTVMISISELDPARLNEIFAPLEERARLEMEQEQQQLPSLKQTSISYQREWDLRYLGQSYEISTGEQETIAATLERFHELHRQRFGHRHPEQAVQLVAIRVRAILEPEPLVFPRHEPTHSSVDQAQPGTHEMTFVSGQYQVPLYERIRLHTGQRIVGPALIVQDDSSVLLPPGWSGSIDPWENLLLERTGEDGADSIRLHTFQGQRRSQEFDPVSLEIFKHLFSSVAEEMGVTLGRTAYSPNIKERKDYSCACFNAEGDLIAQAAHIPVHLGAMPFSVRAAIERFEYFEPGDLVILNDPFLGGTHLPDVTLVKPVFVAEDPDGHTGELLGFVASRAHHADMGGISPGSMPMSRELYQEGLIIPPLKLARRGVINTEILEIFYRNVRTPQERQGDMDAQIAAAAVGERRLQELVARYGSLAVKIHEEALLAYSDLLTRTALAQLPSDRVEFTDYLDDDGWDSGPLPVAVALQVEQGLMSVDFTGSAPQSTGCVNAVKAVTYSGVFYVVRCLVGERVPVNAGCLRPITITIPPGTILNPLPPAAVAAGNVETSQRTVDVLFGALAQLAPERVPAASQGTMNNVTFGGYDPVRQKHFAYYETIGGGMGARPGADGLSGVHVHMSNTRNTPVEALEMELPVRVRRYALRSGSGGAGHYHGGDGLCRELTFLVPTNLTILADRRLFAPYGLHGGMPGQPGENILEYKGEYQHLPGKITLLVQSGATLMLYTPGGGGLLPVEEV